jgi:hypothetical protein
MTTATSTTSTTKRTPTKTVEISTWGHTGRCASVADLVSDEPVRVRQDGWDRAQDAYARRLARVAGRGLQMIACSPQGCDARGGIL